MAEFGKEQIELKEQSTSSTNSHEVDNPDDFNNSQLPDHESENVSNFN